MNKWSPLMLIAAACATSHPSETGDPASNDAADTSTPVASQILQTPIQCAYIMDGAEAETTPYIPLNDLCVVSSTYFDKPTGTMNQRGWYSDWETVPIPSQCLDNLTCDCLAPLGICAQGLNCVVAPYEIKTIYCLDACMENKDNGWYFTCNCTTPAGERYCSANNNTNPDLICSEGGYEEDPKCSVN